MRGPQTGTHFHIRAKSDVALRLTTIPGGKTMAAGASPTAQSRPVPEGLAVTYRSSSLGPACVVWLLLTGAAGAAVEISAVEPVPADLNREPRLLRRFAPARFRVTLVNRGDEPAPGVLAAEVVGHLDTVYPLAPHSLELAAGQTRHVDLAWNAPGPVIYEGMPGGPVRVAGAVWGLQLNVAWLDAGRVTSRCSTVFVVDRDGTSDKLAAELARAETLAPAQAFALRYSGYLNNPVFQKIDLPADPRLVLAGRTAVGWRRGEATTDHETFLIELAPGEKAARATLTFKTLPQRLRQGWLLEPGRQRATRLYHRSDQRVFTFEVPPAGAGAVLVLELGRAHHVPAAPFEEMVARGEKQFGKFRDLLTDASGKAVSSREAWEAHRAERRASIRRAVGSPMAARRVPLDPKPVSEEVVPAGVHINGLHGSYTRRKVSLQVAAGQRMNVWLLVPPGIGPFPAVLACHQTVAEGKDEPAGLGGVHSQVNFGPFLASRGFVVLAADSPTAGERFDGTKDRVWDTSAMEAKDPSWCLLGQRLHDHQCCLDYLETLPFVDPKRLGAIGHSLGGESVLVLAAMDDRVAAAVASCCCPLLRTLKKAGEIYAGKGHVILPPSLRGLLDAPVNDRKLPFDFDDCMALWAPRPVFYHEVTDELPHWTNAAQTAQALKAAGRVYEFLGAKDRLHVHYSRQAHCFPQWVQDDAFDWLDYWLKR